MSTSNIIQEFTFRKGSKILGQLELVQYSPKAIALFGATFPIKDILMTKKGRFNSSLQYNGGKAAGFIFPNWLKKQIIEALNHPSVAISYINQREQAFAEIPVRYPKVISNEIIEAQEQIRQRLS
ncbi:MAG: hypothetical protein RID25_23355 [Cyclobacteriaceae bacterium]